MQLYVCAGWTHRRDTRFSRLAFVLAVLLVAGCGGQGKKDETDKEDAARARGVAQPKPKQPITAELKRLNAAQAARSCKRYIPLTFSIIRQTEPGAPASKAECADFTKANRRVKPAVFDQSAEYGTAAFMEGPSLRPGRGIRSQALWALDTDGRFRFVQVAGQEPKQLGTRPATGANAAANANAFVAAVRRRDCNELAGVLNPGGRLVAGGGSLRGGCKVVFNGKLFAPALKESPGARAVELGATRNFAFFGVSTKKAYFTLLLRTTPGDDESQMSVMDVLPNTPIELPKG